MEVIQRMQDDLESNVKDLKKLEEDFRKMIKNKQTMMERKSENEMALQEVKLLEDDANIYKLIGPVLVKQDMPEAKSILEKRLEYIEREITGSDHLEKDLQSKITKKTESINKIQGDLQNLIRTLQK